MTILDWVRGDYLGLQIPAHSDALHAGGTAFLTRAFQAAGTLAADNQVTQITQCEDWPGGSTGRKLLLTVEYEKPAPDLHTKLFVKFSRDFDNAIRDRARNQMAPEVQLALLSQTPGFPITVPASLFADYHQDSGTGILITQRIEFGTNGIEPHYEKCLDYAMPAPLEHYQALLKALARLAGTHKAGGLNEHVAGQFPFDRDKALASDRIPYSTERLLNRVARLADFAARYPQLLPDTLRTPQFFSQLREDIPHFVEHESAIKQFLYGRPEFIALIHWNANVDNAWFWRDDSGELHCGLLDWGTVGQMNIALALWGALSAAEPDLWDNHLDELLLLFVTEFNRCGGPALNVQELKVHLCLFIALMGLAWLMDAPPLIQAQIPDLSQTENRFDSRFRSNETARTQLHMLTNFLNLWQTQGFGRVLRESLL